MLDFGKILIVSPHPDDEVLGCGGIMSKYAKDVHVHYVTFHHPLVDYNVYRAENAKLMFHLLLKGGSSCYSPENILRMTNQLHTLPITTLVTQFEELIQKVRPTTVLVCYPSYNQDHRTVFEALLTATRPHDRNWMPKNILVYEQPETLHTNRIGTDQFRPQVFVPIDVEEKIKLYEFYQSQIRGHRGTDTIRALACLRGSFISKPFAEAFEVMRITI